MQSGGREGSGWIDIANAIIFGFDFFGIDRTNVRNRATLFREVELDPFPVICKPVLSKSNAQIHVYHHGILPAEVLRP